jgi:hypothetical protein
VWLGRKDVVEGGSLEAAKMLSLVSKEESLRFKTSDPKDYGVIMAGEWNQNEKVLRDTLISVFQREDRENFVLNLSDPANYVEDELLDIVSRTHNKATDAVVAQLLKEKDFNLIGLRVAGVTLATTKHRLKKAGALVSTEAQTVSDIFEAKGEVSVSQETIVSLFGSNKLFNKMVDNWDEPIKFASPAVSESEMAFAFFGSK